MLTIIENGEVYAPEFLGKQSILLVGDKIAKVGEIDPSLYSHLEIGVQLINAECCYIIPGLIDPHVHLIGGGGEGGFATRTPELKLTDLTRSAITTVVGVLGTDGTTRHMTSLLAKARALEEEGVTAYIYTGNYHVPTPTITGSVKDDVILIDKVIGAGEIAISDFRGAQATIQELAKLVAEARIGGLLSNKAGVTHFHTGPGKGKLHLLHRLIEEYDIPASTLYATHITRSMELLDDAIALSHKGAYVDITCDESTPEWLSYFKKKQGNLEHLTLSSDGNGSLPRFDETGQFIGLCVASPSKLFEQLVQTIRQGDLTMEEAISLVTANTAHILKLKGKGHIAPKADADLVVLKKDSFEVNYVIAGGKTMVAEGQPIVKGTFEG